MKRSKLLAQIGSIIVSKIRTNKTNVWNIEKIDDIAESILNQIEVVGMLPPKHYIQIQTDDEGESICDMIENYTPVFDMNNESDSILGNILYFQKAINEWEPENETE